MFKTKIWRIVIVIGIVMILGSYQSSDFIMINLDDLVFPDYYYKFK